MTASRLARTPPHTRAHAHATDMQARPPAEWNTKMLNGKQIVFTGTLQMKRDDAKKQAEAAGAKVSGSVTGNTDILVCGAGVGAKKTDDAAKKGVEVWTEEEFMSTLSGAGGGSGSKKRGVAVSSSLD
jgi:NAD-dependent DNA ligase